ncbi:IPExxxVDY family protein [Wenyingzhuangia sp. IMCC45574]
MAKTIINFCEFEELDYEIVVIHSVLQDYKLAYKINQNLGFNLSRLASDLEFKSNENDNAFFSVFEFQESKSLIDWHLIKNKYKMELQEKKSEGLFSSETSFVSSYVYLQPELKDVDYLLKIQGDFDFETIEDAIRKINKIEGVITSYKIDKEKLNHKEHLIF